MRAKMYIEAKEFAKEVDELKVFQDQFSERDLANLHFTTLLYPRVRLLYPELVARRIYFETRRKGDTPIGLIEPDGARWDIASELHEALYKYDNYIAFGQSIHPFSRIDGRYSEFVALAENLSFERKDKFKIDVASDNYQVLHDDSHIEYYYSSWQVLLAVEVVQSGMHIGLNWHSKTISDDMMRDALVEGKLPDVPSSRSLSFAHALKEFKKYQDVLDAATTLRERSDIYFFLLHRTKSGRFATTIAEQKLQQDFEIQTAQRCAKDFRVTEDNLVDAIRYLLQRWLSWSRKHRPAVCRVYEQLINIAVSFAMMSLDKSFQEIKSHIESNGAHRVSILNEIWPDWVAENKKKTLLTLRGAMQAFPSIVENDLVQFLDFIIMNGLETFFWRLGSFEEHALRGNDFRISGMHAEIQGMAIVVEHVARTITQSNRSLRVKKGHDMLNQFKCIFGRNHAVVSMLNDNPVFKPAVSAQGSESVWVDMRSHLTNLRMQGIEGAMVADLVTARYVRGAVHYKFPNVDYFEMEEIFVSLMRAAFFCFHQSSRP